jgi:sterol desaturase/sphingolipid hydroxylase (fatty acid hydroxylase superfamily)
MGQRLEEPMGVEEFLPMDPSGWDAGWETGWEAIAKPLITIACFALLWTWETFFPLVVDRKRRWRHAGRNVAIALLNVVILGVLFGTVTLGVATWTADRQVGLLYWLDLTGPWRWLLALLLLDAWLYTWHRLNHRVPLLWRFHRMHHSDKEMDVTSATRFHLGEHLGAATLRLGLIPLFGVTVVEILVYELLVVAVTMFHHANITLGRFDRPLRWLIVTPRMHQIHHSRWQPETDSNYAVIFSFWDRLAATYRMRVGSEPVDLGLDEFQEEGWQSVWGMLKTPFVNITRGSTSVEQPDDATPATEAAPR